MLLITKVPRANNYVSELTHYLIGTKVDLVTGIEAAYWLVRLSNFPGDGSSPGFHNFSIWYLALLWHCHNNVVLLFWNCNLFVY